MIVAQGIDSPVMRRVSARVPLAAAGCVGGIMLFGAADAAAFCRSVGEAPPLGWDVESQGCFAGAEGTKEFYWKNACVAYSLQKEASSQVTLEQATQAIDAAFAAWSDVTCAGGGHPAINAVDVGPVECGLVQYNKDQPNQHVVVFRDDEWPYSDPNNTLGLTTVTFDKTTGEIYDADMEINSSQHVLTTAAPAAAGTFDLQSIFVHEAGHFLGLAHSEDAGAIMAAHYRVDSPVPKADDASGICAVYPADGMRVTSDGPVAADACDPRPRHGFSAECGAPGGSKSESVEKTGGCAVAGGVGRGGATAWLAFLAFGLVVRRRRAGRAPGWPRVAALCATMALFGAAMMSIASDAGASVSIAVLFEELLEHASAVAVVTPVEQHAVWQNGRIYSYTRVHVDMTIAGSLPNDPWIRTMGGVVGNIGQIVEGEAVLTAGRPALIFLSPPLDPEARSMTDIFEVTARAQGAFPLARDENEARRVIRASSIGALMPPPPERIARAARRLGAAGAPRLARDVLSDRLLDAVARDIVAAWPRLHEGAN
jgi:hypothetical protein